MRGPLVYCLESTDLPTGVPCRASVFDPKRTPHFDRKLLGGVTTLEARAQVVANGAWKDELYREFQPMVAKTIDVRLIPYYAWSNRGKSDMSVWLPLGR